MYDGLETVRINRVIMRANEFAFYYRTMKELVNELLSGNKLRASKRIVIDKDTVIYSRTRRCQRILCGVSVFKSKSETGSAMFYINIHESVIK